MSEKKDLTGKLAVITGANSGIGLEASVQLGQRGCEIVMCCRSLDKAEHAKSDIAKRSGLDPSKIYIVQLDLTDLDNVEAFRSRYDAVPGLAGRPIDMLILNAGIMAPPTRELTKQGLESQMGTNVVGHFKFAGIMIDLCKRAPISRVVFVSSIMHRFASTIRFDDFSFESYSAWPIYCQTKLADLALALKLNRVLETAGITNIKAVACHPGYSATNLQTLSGGSSLNYFFAQSASTGAAATVLAATDPNAPPNGYAGPWFMNLYGKPTWGRYINPVAKSVELQDKLWAKCEEITQTRFESKL